MLNTSSQWNTRVGRSHTRRRSFSIIASSKLFSGCASYRRLVGLCVLAGGRRRAAGSPRPGRCWPAAA